MPILLPVLCAARCARRRCRQRGPRSRPPSPRARIPPRTARAAFAARRHNRRADGRTGRSRSPHIRGAAARPEAMARSPAAQSARAPAPPPNNSLCPIAAVSWLRCARAKHGIDCRENPRAILLERIEGARGRKTFQHALVDRARIDAARRNPRDRRMARSPRAAMIASTACRPTPLSAASA